MSVAGTVTAAVALYDEQTVGVNANAEKRPANINKGYTFTDGVGALQANQLFQAKRTLGGSPDDLDLAGTALQDVYGVNVGLARIKSIYIENLSSSNTMTIGNATNAISTMLGATSTLVLRPGGSVTIVAPDATGYVITAGSADILRVSGTSGDQYKIVVLGAKT